MLAVRRGNKAAFTLLYERFKGPIFSYLRGLVREEAEDLLHETFLRVYRSRERYEPSARFSTWLWTIAHNVAMDRLRKKTELLDLEAGGPEPATGDDESAEALLVEQAERERVERCMEALPPRQREAVLLRTLSEHSYEEIAELMELTLANVKTLIHRAKEGLARCLRNA